MRVPTVLTVPWRRLSLEGRGLSVRSVASRELRLRHMSSIPVPMRLEAVERPWPLPVPLRLGPKGEGCK